jgi:hypothetical protein
MKNESARMQGEKKGELREKTPPNSGFLQHY